MVSLLTPMELLSLVAVFFVTNIFSVITGSTSLITALVTLQPGIEPISAAATIYHTNMSALTVYSFTDHAGVPTPMMAMALFSIVRHGERARLYVMKELFQGHC